MAFPLGRPLQVMLVIAVATGIVVSLRPPQQRADLQCWIFADSHRRAFAPIIPAFERREHLSVELDLIAYRAMYVRLLSLFMTGARGPLVPDAVSVEIGQVGKFFRPPVDGVGLRPLGPYLESTGAREIVALDAYGEKGWHARLVGDGHVYTHDGERWTLDPTRTRPDMWIDRIVRNRFAPWSKQGVIFGVPMDVHPTTLTYREDLFREAGVDLAACRTWPEFHEACLRFQRYWAEHGAPLRHAIEMPELAADRLAVLLLQRGINPVDDRDVVHLAEPKVANTVAFFAQLVVGPRAVAATSAGSYQVLAKEMDEGVICSCLTPDWAVSYLREGAPPTLLGKLRMIPLPVFDADDAPTSTMGGTCMGIPKGCDHPDQAWKLIEHLYFSDESFAERMKLGTILPPLPEQWRHPLLHQEDPLYGGQRIFETYIALMPRIPARCVTPSTNLALAQLSLVLGRAVDRARAGQVEHLEQDCQTWLNEAAADVERRIAHGKFE